MITPSSPSSKSGLSFIEFLFALLCLVILGFFVVPRFFSSSDTSRYSAHLKEVNEINTQLENYRFKYNTYPSSMTDAAWKGPNGEPSTDFFPFGVPQSNVYGNSFDIVNGRVYAEKKGTSFQKKSKKKMEHKEARDHIDSVITRYYAKYKEYPKGMHNANWIGPMGDSFRVFFPDGVPRTCNEGTEWAILNGKLDTTHHEGHE